MFTTLASILFFASLLLLFLLLFANNFVRSRRNKNFALKPNCLLTRHQIVFIPGKKSLFYFANYWNSIPAYLQEHGYQVTELALPWRHEKARQLELKSYFFDNAHETKYHVIASGQEEALWIKQQQFSSVLSISTPDIEQRSTITPSDLTPNGLLYIRNLQNNRSSHSFVRFYYNLVLFFHCIATDSLISFFHRPFLELAMDQSIETVAQPFLELATHLAERDYIAYE